MCWICAISRKSHPGKIVHDYNVIFNDPEIQIVVEVMGGVEPAYTFVNRALVSGRASAPPIRSWWPSHGPS